MTTRAEHTPRPLDMRVAYIAITLRVALDVVAEAADDLAPEIETFLGACDGLELALEHGRADRLDIVLADVEHVRRAALGSIARQVRGAMPDGAVDLVCACLPKGRSCPVCLGEGVVRLARRVYCRALLVLEASRAPVRENERFPTPEWVLSTLAMPVPTPRRRSARRLN